MLKDTFGADKPIIGMIHLAALPGSPLHDAAAGMFGNENARPYLLKASPVTLAAFAFAVGQLKPMLRLPFGVNYLWDPVATVSLAIASGARFAREIFTGVYESDMGLWAPDAASAVRLRSDGGRPDLKLLFNIN